MIAVTTSDPAIARMLSRRNWERLVPFSFSETTRDVFRDIAENPFTRRKTDRLCDNRQPFKSIVRAASKKLLKKVGNAQNLFKKDPRFFLGIRSKKRYG